MRLFLKIGLVLLALLLLRLSVYTVDAAEYAYITLLGKPLETYDGSDADKGAGLHVGWPWPIQTVQRLDRRLQHFDLPATEILTHDPDGKTIDKTLSIEAYVCWRIADRDAVDLFIRRLGTPEKARSIIGPRVGSLLGAAITQMAMDDLVSTEAGKEAGKTKVDDKMEYLRGQLLDGLRGPLRKDYGVELVDIRLRRFSHPAAVRESIFRRIRSERMKKVTEYESEGERQAKNIDSATEQKVRAQLAAARSEEEKLKGQADADAMRIRNQAHRQDPEFYAFLKKMEKLQSILGDNKTVLLLSTHRPLFDLLFEPPNPRLKETPSPERASPAKKEDQKSKETGGPR
jgi:membrane protease subunit HflC